MAVTILVTGGAGYIGAHTVRALRERGERVVVLDLATTGDPAAVPSDVPFVRGDVRDGALVEEALRAHRISAVIHFAAEKSVARSMASPGPTFGTNVGGTLALLEAMVAAGVDRLVFSSSCAVYGTPGRLPIDEEAPLGPDNPYGESKAIAERMIAWFGRLSPIRSVVLRYFNAAGAHPAGDLGEDWRDAENLVPAVLRAAWTGMPVSVFGSDYPTPDGTAIRDYVHVVDLAEAHLAALDHLAAGRPSETLNLGTGTGSTVREVIETARAVTGRPIPTRDAPRRPGDPAAVWADPSRAAAILGWRARRELAEMVASAWAWHRAHPEGRRDRAGQRVPEPAASVSAGRSR